MDLDLEIGRLKQATWLASPNFDARDAGCVPETIIIHCISLPPGQYGGGEVAKFFQNMLAPEQHPYFESMAHLTVSSHFLIDRQGELSQFVSTDMRAWHAGESVCLERPKVNNFSIGIELEGWDEDTQGFTQAQYQNLAELVCCLLDAYPTIDKGNIFAHSDIAPGRKPDPGPYFNWALFLSLLDNASI